MSKTAKLIIFTLVILIIGAACEVRADDALDNILGPAKSDLKESSSETVKLWEGFLTALEQNDFAKGRKLAADFDAVQDFTEPWQKSYTKLVIEILSQKDKAAAADADARQVAVDKDTQVQIATATKQKNDILSSIVSLQNENDAKKQQLEVDGRKLANAEERVNKKNKDNVLSDTIGSVIGGPAGGVVSRTGNADKENAQRDVNAIKADISSLKQDISNNERSILNSNQQITALSQTVANLNKQGTQQVRDRQQAIAQTFSQQRGLLHTKVLNFMKQLLNVEKQFRSAVILASTYTQNIGEDAEISTLAQAAVDFQKEQTKAIAIAQAASKSVMEALTQKKPWTAKSELVKANDTINERVTTEPLKGFVTLEMARITRAVKAEVDAALKEQAIVMEKANRDAVGGALELEIFKQKYSDYPNYEQDKLRISDLRAQEVAKKWEARLAAIDEVSHNDGAEAKRMIVRLQAELDPDQLSVLKSRITRLQTQILDREIAECHALIAEAQSYLTKVVFENIQGKTTGRVTAGIENLVRARSLQAGAVKRMEMLLDENTDNVTKSRLVGELETAKAALGQMDGTLNQQNQSSKTIIIIAVVAGALFLVVAFLAVVGVVVWKLRKKPAAAVPVLTK